MMCKTSLQFLFLFFQYANMCSSADTLYMCYCIDVDRGAMHKAEVFDAVGLGLY